MKIYLCWARKNNERVLSASFSNLKTAKNYCKSWNESQIGYFYYFTESLLDYHADSYKDE